MTWKDQLRPASFRGVPFRVDAHEAPMAGRRVARHQYPGRDRPWAEDMGRRIAEFELAGYVIGPDYMAARDRLVDACNAPGPGVLVHPYLGELSVMCEGCRPRESTAEGGMATFELKFVESGREEYPAPRADAAAVVSGAAAAARADAVSQFLEGWTAAIPDWAEDALAADVRSAAERLGFGSAVQALETGAAALVRDAAKLAPAVVAAVDGTPAGDLAAVARDALPGRPPIPSTTPARRAQAANRAAIGALFADLAAIRLAGAATSASYPDRSAAARARDRLADAMDLRERAAGDALFRVLRTLGAEAGAALSARIGELPPLVSATPASVGPALVLAYDLYGDLSREADIARRAGAARPGFVPADPIELAAA